MHDLMCFVNIIYGVLEYFLYFSSIVTNKMFDFYHYFFILIFTLYHPLQRHAPYGNHAFSMRKTHITFPTRYAVQKFGSSTRKPTAKQQGLR